MRRPMRAVAAMDLRAVAAVVMMPLAAAAAVVMMPLAAAAAVARLTMGAVTQWAAVCYLPETLTESHCSSGLGASCLD